MYDYYHMSLENLKFAYCQDFKKLLKTLYE